MTPRGPRRIDAPSPLRPQASTRETDMALDRWIGLVILMICLAYGYGAFFTMDAGLPQIGRAHV